MSIINSLFAVEQSSNNRTIERYKEEFYIGKISRVYKDKCYVQTDNFSLLRSRINRSDFLVPNTIDHLVVIDSITGVYLAEVVGAQLSEGTVNHDALINSSDSLHPLLQIKLVGIYQDKKFKLPGFSNVGIGDKVYVANSKIEEIYQSSLEISKNTSLDESKLSFASIPFFNKQNVSFKISPDGLLSNHFMILGATNSGKSTSALSILEQLNKQEIKFLLIDPTGEYISAFEDKDKIESLVLGENTKMNTSIITDEQWLMLLDPNTETQEQQLLTAIKELKAAKECIKENNDFKKIIENGLIKKEEKYVKDVEEILRRDVPNNVEINALQIVDQLKCDAVVETGGKTSKYKYDNFKDNTLKWLIDQVNYRLNKLGLNDFLGINESSSDSENSETKKYDLLEELSTLETNKIFSLYVNTSKIGIANDSGKMIIDLVCNELLSKRRKKRFEDPECDLKPIVLFIDEVHRYALERDNEGNYSSGLINIAREGRKYGIFLFLTSQSPKDVPSIILNQIGTLLVHNLTGKDDLKIISNYFDEKTLNSLSFLGQGEAILSGINLVKNVQLKIKPSSLKHNNDTPYIGK